MADRVPSNEPHELVEQAANDALRAAQRRLEEDGSRLLECVVIVRAEGCSPDSSTAMHTEDEEPTAGWLLATLLSHAHAVADSVGKTLVFAPLRGGDG